jgi:8-oxo-dGTP pyrophosphatase MutT (NUDIX family)/phosphohistidine phosphatase SixA
VSEAGGTIRAAGAVLWRPAGAGIEICLVHRPAYDDWSLPKGKLHRDEHPLVAAVREVREETGVRAYPHVRLPDVTYALPTGVAKTVEFWAMRGGDEPVRAVADPTEVDDVRWLPPEAAAGTLTYPTDARLVEYVAALPPITAITTLVRHASAGDRNTWVGDDALRPIDPLGQQQAARLRVVLALFQPRRLFAAPPLRCMQTLQPLADALGLPIVEDPVFAEPPQAEDVFATAKVAATRLVELRDGETATVCSQGKVIPPTLALLRGTLDPAPYKTPKGGGWVLSWAGERLVGMSRI